MAVPTSETIRVTGGRSFRGETMVPGDKSISHRALLLAALAGGTSTISGLSDGEDVHHTLQAIRDLGAEVVEEDGNVSVTGGRTKLCPANRPIDLGNSGTGLRLLMGLAATLEQTTVLIGDTSLHRRPMDRVALPLIAMGARVTGRSPRCLPPVEVGGGQLHGIEYSPPMASAQVKSAVLLAAIGAEGETVLHERVRTRAHTEEMLVRMGADITIGDSGRSRTIRVRRSELNPTVTAVPGDPSQAAFWVVGGIVIPGSEVHVRNVYLGHDRTGFVGILSRMGADVTVDEDEFGRGSITGRFSSLTGTVVHAEEIPSLDEVPILAVAAATATGLTRFVGVGELRGKESDRLAGTVALVAAFGGTAREDGDDLVVVGGGGLHPGVVDAHHDHRMAMAAAIAGAACHSPNDVTAITGWETVNTSYPSFLRDLSALIAAS
ncbi:MAG: 3-phosphoshikimate 1-carboxyvinyltransferase [Acidimicrobiales bacterium]